MRAAVLHGPRDIRLDEVPDASIELPTDVVVKVAASSVCGSDLWGYRGIESFEEPTRYGHEFIGTVEDVGPDVTTLRPGQFVVAPLHAVDGLCPQCLSGLSASCVRKAQWGRRDACGLQVDGGQGEAVRVPMADSTLVALSGMPSADLLPGLLAICDVMATGQHAAMMAGVGEGDAVVVVGDGAVGLCAVLAASRLKASRIVVMSRYPDRQRIAREFGATDIVTARGAAGAHAVRELLDDVGASAALECVGTQESLEQAVESTRAGGRIGCVGLPHGIDSLDFRQIFRFNRRIGGGAAHARTYLPGLLADVLSDRIRPGRVFDLSTDLTDVAEAYKAMDERRSIKAMLKP